MKYKHLLKENKIYIYTFLFCFLLMIFMTLNEINLLEGIKNYLFNTDYRHSWFLETDMPEIANGVSHNFIGFLQYRFAIGFWMYDSTITTSTSLFQILIPLISIFGGMTFYRNYNAIYKFTLIKNNCLKTFLYKKMFLNALKLSLSVFTAYLCLMIILHFNINYMTNATSISEAREFLLDIFSFDLYANHTEFYFLIEGIFRFLYIPFIYTLLMQSGVLIFSNFREVFLINIVYYYGLSAIAYALDFILPNVAFYLNPSAFMANGSYSNINSILLIATNSIPLLIFFFLVEWRCRNVEI